MTFNDLLDHTSFKKKASSYGSIHIKFYQNQFINECARKKKVLWDLEEFTFSITLECVKLGQSRELCPKQCTKNRINKKF